VSTLPYLDPALPVADRVEDLLARMTLPEKVGQMLQLDARDGVGPAVLDKHAGSLLHTSPQNVVEAHALTTQTRLGIPLLVAEDCIHGHSFWVGATIFPTQLGMAATWDPELVEQVARATAVEVAATGIHWTFSPVLCIARDLRWGRVDETFGEDPYLIGELASAMVRGYQGDGLADVLGRGVEDRPHVRVLDEPADAVPRVELQHLPDLLGERHAPEEVLDPLGDGQGGVEVGRRAHGRVLSRRRRRAAHRDRGAGPWCHDVDEPPGGRTVGHPRGKLTSQ